MTLCLALALVLLANLVLPLASSTAYADDPESVNAGSNGVYAQSVNDNEPGRTGATRDYSYGTDVGDPISAGNGTYHFSMPLLDLGGPMGLGFGIYYRSDRIVSARLPDAFWAQPFTTIETLLPVTDTQRASVFLFDGGRISFKRTTGDWTLVDPVETVTDHTYVDNGSRTKYVLKETAGFFYFMDPVQEKVYVFQRYVTGSVTQSRIARIIDRNNNQVIYSYATSTDSKPSRIEDGLGRSLDLAYALIGGLYWLQTVTDHGGRRVSLNYEPAGADNDNVLTLRSVTDAMTQTTTFRYGGRIADKRNMIMSQQLPRGNVPYTQYYALKLLNGNSSTRVYLQKDALFCLTSLDYDASANSVRVHRPDGSIQDFQSFSQHSLPKAITDTAGFVSRLEKNENEQVTSLTDRLGDTTSFSYHPETGLLSGVTNAYSQTVSTTYAARLQSFTNPISPTETVDFTFYNVVRADFPDGASEQNTYDASGNLLSQTDRGGQTWTHTYNSRGQVLTTTNPTGGVVSFTYNGDATVASRSETDTGTTSYAYDALKRLTRVTRPDSSTLNITYDANDQVVLGVDGRGNTTSYTYDANGNLTGVTDPLGNTTSYEYDPLDRMTQQTDRLGHATTFTYDCLGRRVSTTDPTGVALKTGYDQRDWPDRVTVGGSTWRTGYDEEGIVISRTTPLGKTERYGRDKLGNVLSVTDPLSQSVSLSRDSMRRVSSESDPLGRVKAYSYDARGLLSGVTSPVIGTAVYTRTALGALSQMADLNGQTWSFGYSPMGRQQTATDPRGRVVQYSYDSMGRPSRTTFPDGVVATNTYDSGGNLTRGQFSDGTDLSFGYDSLNRLTTAAGIQYTYDAEGRIIQSQNPGGATFGATYDGAGRLKTAGYASGAFTVTYSYDTVSGLLSGVSDNLSGAQIQFGYDPDFRLTTTTRNNGIVGTLTWDDATRLTRIQDGSILDLRYTLDAAGQVSQLQMTAPLDPAQALTAATESYSYDAASQIASAGYAYDLRGRLVLSPDQTYVWDGASRLTGAGAATLGYNGLGDVISRTQGISATGYYYNGAISLRPVVAERNENSGQFQRYYVWTPGGRLLYMIDAADGNKPYFYHFDRTGSTLALTDGNGQLSDAYVYDPYGRVLGHEGGSQQPFTFVGQWGVRQEGTGGSLYQMRARYYDARTGRFLSRDPVWPQTGDGKQLNPYQYATNEPIGVTDFTGLQSDKREVLYDRYKEWADEEEYLREEAWYKDHPDVQRTNYTGVNYEEEEKKSIERAVRAELGDIRRGDVASPTGLSEEKDRAAAKAKYRKIENRASATKKRVAKARKDLELWSRSAHTEPAPSSRETNVKGWVIWVFPTGGW